MFAERLGREITGEAVMSKRPKKNEEKRNVILGYRIGAKEKWQEYRRSKACEDYEGKHRSKDLIKGLELALSYPFAPTLLQRA